MMRMLSKNKFTIKKSNLTSEKPNESLVLFFGWLNASEKAISKYGDLYHNRGFDVIYVKGTINNMALPGTFKQPCRSLLDYVETNCSSYNTIIVHASSIGGFNFAMTMGAMSSEADAYRSTRNKIVGIVYDSITPGNIETVARGVELGTNSSTLAAIMSVYLRLNKHNTLDVYAFYEAYFRTTSLNVPTLMFYCKSDPISQYNFVTSLISDWRREFDFPLVEKCWEKSVHVQHLRHHPIDQVVAHSTGRSSHTRTPRQ